MNKNKLITFILNDISELDMLTKCMESMETIPYAMHDLALQKVRNILSEFEQLSVESKEAALEMTEEKPVAAEPVKEACPKVESKDVKKEEKAESEVEKESVVEETHSKQDQKVNVEEELVSPRKNATIKVDVSAIDTVKVVVKEPEPKVVEELSQPVTEVHKEAVKTVETEKTAPSKSVEKKVAEQPKTVISNPVITNERFKGGRRLESRFVTDLRKSLNFNDRFRYQRELFGGDMALLNTTFDKLNSMSSLQEAEAYVAENFNWDTTEGAAFEFMELLEARFTN